MAGYQHDGHANNAAYMHDGHADSWQIASEGNWLITVICYMMLLLYYKFTVNVVRIRPKKKICLFPVTSPNFFGSVGRKTFFFYSFFFFFQF